MGAVQNADKLQAVLTYYILTYFFDVPVLNLILGILIALISTI